MQFDLNTVKYVFPMPPYPGDHITPFQSEQMEVYAHFMRHMRCVPNSRKDIKIYSSIKFTADVLRYSEEQIAKTLVDMGLRAPRDAFPEGFLNYIDNVMQRHAFGGHIVSSSIAELQDHWNQIGEDKFAAFKKAPDHHIFKEKVHQV